MRIIKLKNIRFCSYKRLMFIFVLMYCNFLQYAYADKVYYNIAHMVNSSRMLNWAVSQGANAIEADVKFKGNAPDYLEHGFVCDCTVSPRADVCAEIRRTFRYGYSNMYAACNVSDNFTNYLNLLAQKQTVALFIVDTKAGTIDTANNGLEKAGTNVVQRLTEQLFAKGYLGKVIIGINEFKYFEYLQGAARAAENSPYKNRIYFSIDEEKNPTAVLAKLKTLGTPNIVYGVGITTVAPKSYYSQIQQAASYEQQGQLAMAYIWTIDKASSMRNYLNVGARGVMTNNPGTLSSVYNKFFSDNPGSRLATPADPL